MSNLRMPVLVVLLASVGGACGSDGPAAAARGEMAGAAGAGDEDGGGAGAPGQVAAGGSDAAPTVEASSSDGDAGGGMDAGGEACAGPTITHSWTLRCQGQPIACKDLGVTMIKVAAGAASTTVPCDPLDTGGSVTFQGIGGPGKFSATFMDDGGRVLAMQGPDMPIDFPTCGPWNFGPVGYEISAGRCP